jgi:hypothetical protein
MNYFSNEFGRDRRYIDNNICALSIVTLTDLMSLFNNRGIIFLFFIFFKRMSIFDRLLFLVIIQFVFDIYVKQGKYLK